MLASVDHPYWTYSYESRGVRKTLWSEVTFWYFRNKTWNFVIVSRGFHNSFFSLRTSNAFETTEHHTDPLLLMLSPSSRCCRCRRRSRQRQRSLSSSNTITAGPLPSSHKTVLNKHLPICCQTVSHRANSFYSDVSKKEPQSKQSYLFRSTFWEEFRERNPRQIARKFN